MEIESKFKDNFDTNILVKYEFVIVFVLLSLICSYDYDIVLFGQEVLAKSAFDLMSREFPGIQNQFNESISSVQLDSANIFLSGLGGAIFGAVFASIFQYYLSKRENSNKEHFSELKKEIVDPIIKSISKTSELNFFTIDLSDLFLYYQNRSDVVIETRNIIIKDFFDNHYPHIYELLHGSLNMFNKLKKKRGDLTEKIEIEIADQFSTLSTSVNEIFNPLSIKNVRNAVFDGKYNDALIRSTSAEGSAYVYFSFTDNYLIPFGPESEEFTIIQIRGNNLQQSKERANEIRGEILKRLDSIVKENHSGLENYRSEERSFQIEKNRLLTELRRIKYSTSMKNLKSRLSKKKCIFLN